MAAGGVDYSGYLGSPVAKVCQQSTAHPDKGRRQVGVTGVGATCQACHGNNISVVLSVDCSRSMVSKNCLHKTNREPATKRTFEERQCSAPLGRAPVALTLHPLSSPESPSLWKAGMWER